MTRSARSTRSLRFLSLILGGGAAGLLATSAHAAGDPITRPCPAHRPLTKADGVNDCLRVLDARHEYIVHVPARYFDRSAKSVPLLLDLVGNEMDPNHERRTSGQLEQSDRRGFIAVWPKPSDTKGTGPDRGWQIKDEGFLRTVISQMQGLYGINNRRIYMTGHSKGGYMTHQMGCRAADVLRAIAPTSYPLNYRQDCDPRDRHGQSVAISETTFHGMDDANVAFGDPDTDDQTPDTHNLTTARDSLLRWAQVDKCDVGKEPDREPVYPNQPNNGSHVISYGGCGADRYGDQAKVRLVAIRHAPHDIFGFQGPDRVDVAEVIWNRVFNDD